MYKITKYNGRLPEGEVTPSKMAAGVNLNNPIDNEKQTKESKANKPIKTITYWKINTFVSRILP